jgi:hypothetical protein
MKGGLPAKRLTQVLALLLPGARVSVHTLTSEQAEHLRLFSTIWRAFPAALFVCYRLGVPCAVF